MAVEPLRRGRVAAFDEQQGLGTVEDEAGRRWSFHCARIADGTRRIDVGTSVVFAVGPGAPGRWEAISVVPTSSVSPTP